jgi:hypothetical protein
MGSIHSKLTTLEDNHLVATVIARDDKNAAVIIGEAGLEVQLLYTMIIIFIQQPCSNIVRLVHYRYWYYW